MRFLKEEPRILYQDEHIIGVYKPPNMPTQPDSSKDYSLLEWARHNLYGTTKKGEYYLGIVHRLDRPVPGVVIFAKTQFSAKELSRCFKERKVRKIYWAVVEGIPTKREDTLSQNIIQHRSDQSSTREAILHYRVLSVHNDLSLLEIHLVTGLRHQIRIQLSFLGHPVLNDARYGRIHRPYHCIGLMAKEISLMHPLSKQTIKIQSPIPKSFPWPKEMFPR